MTINLRRIPPRTHDELRQHLTRQVEAFGLTVVGWGSLSPYSERPAYDATVAQYLSETGNLLGEEVVSIHETLDVPRVVSLPVRLMLPWRMPRRLFMASPLTG